MVKAQAKPYKIEPWRTEHDATAFSSGMASIDRYIKEQAQRDMSSHVSLVFVLTQPGENIVRAYYSLSALGIIFDELPKSVQKRLPRYPQIGATLLGRLGVDRVYSAEREERLGEKPRLGELVLVDAQKKTLLGAISSVGSAQMIIDVLMPTDEEIEHGARNPMDFYTQYGFIAFPGNNQRVFKTTRTIEAEFKHA